MNGVKLTSKYSKPRITKPIRICKYETKIDLEAFKHEKENRKNLLVKNIEKQIGANFVWKTFRKYGDIRSLKLVTDMNGNSKGFGYVNYVFDKDAENALRELVFK